uniref:KIB1-4 beta-propeller domain-containing protein n=1 Tax=Aegilops tauschii TaxID=37682 RepID=M8BC81_AEGTA
MAQFVLPHTGPLTDMDLGVLEYRAMLAAPPVLPWLIFSLYGGKSRHAYCPEKCGVLRIRLRRQVLTGKRLVGAQDGGWVAVIGGKLRLVIVNLFSGTKCNGLPPYPRYIIELHGKLAMVARINSPRVNHEPIFKVLKLAYKSTMTAYTHQWEELLSLGDYALFLGAKSSKLVYVPSSRHNGVQRSCIYADDMTYLTRSDGHGDCVYPVQGKSSHDARHMIKSAGLYVTPGADTSGMWIFPPNFWAINNRQARHL